MTLTNRIKDGEFETSVPYTSTTKEEYKADVEACNNRFKEAVREDLGYEAGPQWDILWEKAWQEGHADGYYSVYDHAIDLDQFLEKWQWLDANDLEDLLEEVSPSCVKHT